MCTTAGPSGAAALGLFLFALVVVLASLYAIRRPHHVTRVAALAASCVAAVGSVYALARVVDEASPSPAMRVLPILPPMLLVIAALWGYAVWRPSRRVALGALALAVVGLALGALALFAPAAEPACVG